MTKVLTISCIVTAFRDGLVALTGPMDKVAIPWREGEAYDDWDSIVTAIFEAVVVNTVRWGLPKPDRDGLSFARYDFAEEQYGAKAFISVHDQSRNQLGALVSFVTKNAPFDTVRVAKLGQDLSVVGQVEVPLAVSTFSCSVPAGQRRTSMTELTIEE